MASMHAPRRIRKLLVANRAEIAVRILQTARELNIDTFAIYSPGDDAHISAAHHAIKLSSPDSYTDINAISAACRTHQIDHVHPGYGFLSESADFASQLADQGVTVIGPGHKVLARTGDKLEAKALARECQVPLLPSMLWQDETQDQCRRFIAQTGYPILLKRADGGGGRGIRIVRRESELAAALERAKRDGGSSFFVEKAAIDDFHHVEVQVVGDGKGGVRHLWERDCSIQRRFQKMVEVAPSPSPDRKLLEKVISSALAIASKVKYYSLGTFEFLTNDATGEFYFLEINPRIQVEHTISEQLASLDLVRVQLQLAQGVPLDEQLPELSLLGSSPSQPPPPLHSIQLRLCAEDPAKGFALSVGRTTEFRMPSGNGVRVDTHIRGAAVVSPDFDNLLAKIIVTAPSWEACVSKARRALEDTAVTGVSTNLSLLRGIVSSDDFTAGKTNTQWLEHNVASLLQRADEIRASHSQYGFATASSTSSSNTQGLSSMAAVASTVETVMLRPNDAWSVALTPRNDEASSSSSSPPTTHHLRLDKISLNQFPSTLTGLLTHTSTSTPPQTYHLSLQATTQSSTSLASTHLSKGDASNPTHILAPLAGRLVELRFEEGDVVREGEIVGYVKQMKMEIEVRARKGGRVVWSVDVGDDERGVEVGEGTLLLVVVEGEGENDVSSKEAKL